VKKLTFEEAFQRLEQILERMNAADVALEESLTLFEEANTLIISCQKELAYAEKRIEKLVRNRQGELEMQEGNPKTESMNIEP